MNRATENIVYEDRNYNEAGDVGSDTFISRRESSGTSLRHAIYAR